ncbi:MAG: response regulator [Desulfonauticus sp.]|nr:response regulator [Desulfonauticus sp.]
MVDAKRKEKILVVDDEESLRLIFEDALTDEGYEVVTAKDGQEALGILKQDKDIDLVVSDLKMPRLNGIELLKKIKEENIDVEFLVMTGFGTIEVAVECIKLGASDYIPKPFNITHLLIKIKKVLEKRQKQREKKRLSNIVRILNLGNSLNKLQTLDDIIEEFVFHLQNNFNPDSLMLSLYNNITNKLEQKVVKGNFLYQHYDIMFDLSIKMTDFLEKNKLFFVSKHRFSGVKGDFAIIIIPLRVQREKIGVIALIKKNNGEPACFIRDRHLLQIFCMHAANSLQNARFVEQLKTLNLKILSSYSKAVEVKDYYTKGHSENVAKYAFNFGQFIGLSQKELELLYIGGVLHDIGKIGIPDNILNKPDKLTDEEYGVIKKHPVIGKEILEHIEFFEEVIPLVHYHHERIDGQGYPEGLIGDRIPFLVKIISIADGFDAMTSDRSYRRGMPLEKVEKIFEQGAGTQWDFDLVQKWLFLIKTRSKEELQRVEFKGIFNMLT